MKNKKGFIPLAAVPLGTVIVGAILLLLIFIGTFAFISINKFLLAGITIIILELIYIIPAAMQSDLTREKIILLIFIFLIGLIVMLLPTFGLVQQSILTTGEELTYLVPHKAGIKCEIIETTQIQATIPSNGVWISKDNIGFKSKIVKDIRTQINIGSGIGSCGSFSSCRIRWKICNVDGNNCQEYTNDITYTTAGNDLTYEKSFNSIDLSQQSLFIIYEKATNFPLYNNYDKEFNDGKISYNAEKYGLNIYSTTAGFTTICSTSCDLSCPQQSVREKIIETPLTSLNYLESVNYIEFWDEVSQMGIQNGATIYNPLKNEFCFGGFIYNAGKLNLENGKRYVYPDSFKKQVPCCSGAVINSITNDQICENEQWKIISKSTQIQCISDEQCPGSGVVYGQQLQDNSLNKYQYKCENKICVQKDLGKAECIPPSIGCASDQICDSNFKCVGGSPNLIPDNLNNNSEGDTLKCNWYQQKQIREVVDNGFFGWRKLFNAGKVNTITECKLNPLIPLIGVFIVVIILIVALILSLPKSKKKRRK